MKSYLVKPVCFISALMFAAFGAQATEGEEDQTLFEQKILLSPADPALDGIEAKAKLKVENEDGGVEAELEVETEGLPVGEYTVQVTRTSDGTTEVIGVLEVALKDEDDDDDDFESESDDDGEGEDDGDGDGDCDDDDGELETKGEVEFNSPFTNDVDPLDIESISILDDGGKVILAGSFSDLESTQLCRYKANVKLVDESVSVESGALSGVKGHIVVHAKVVNGEVTKNKFLLVGKGFQPQTLHTIVVDGTPVGTATTNKNGKLMVKKLTGINLLEVSIVEVFDDLGSLIASASF